MTAYRTSTIYGLYGHVAVPIERVIYVPLRINGELIDLYWTKQEAVV